MAKFLSNQFAHITGSMNGIVYSTNSISPYIRNRSIPINLQTPVQQIQRDQTASISSYWNNLFDSERLQWAVAASGYSFPNGVGGFYTPSGYQLYMMSNQNSLLLGSLIIRTPIAHAGIGQVISLISDINTTMGTFDITINLLPTGTNCKLYFTPPVSTGLALGSVKNQFKLFRDLSLIPLIYPSNSIPFNVAASYDNQFGTNINGAVPPAGAIWLKIIPIRPDFINAAPLFIKTFIHP